MGIAAEDIERVRAASDFVQIASEHIALKRVGQRWVGLCPFHTEKTPSFSVNAQEGLYYCFGCQAKGDVITFVREVEHLDFADAVERLASRAGIELHYDDPAASKERQRRTKLIETMERAVEWYHQRLLTAADAAPARSYLRSRGYDGEVVRTYRLGWAPDEWDALCRALQVPLEVVHDTGLGFLNRRGRQQDGFRGRVMFPIFDVRGDPVAFGGRALQGMGGPKYRNSPETPIYSKSRVLYGLNWAKQAVVEQGEVVVCEGYTDVIGLARAGVRTAVATCGTALADEHFRLLKNFARRVVLAYDADAAGQAAAARFYEWERRYDVDIAVAQLPSGQDPADLAFRDPEALRTAIAEARPFLAFRLDRALAGADLRSPEGRARAAEAALDVVAEHPGELVRDQYLMDIADRTRIDADRLRPLLTRSGPAADRRTQGSGASRPPGRSGGRGLERPGQSGGRGLERPGRSGGRGLERPGQSGGRGLERPGQSGGHGPEIEALRVAVHDPEAVAHRLHEVLFADERVRAAYLALASATTLHQAIDEAPPEVATLLQRLAVEEADSDPDDVLARLVTEAAHRELAAIESAARQSSAPIDFAAQMAWLKLAMEDLRDPGRAVEATDRLVRWLVERPR